MLRELRRRFADDQGLSLAELLISAVMSIFVLIIISGLMINVMTTTKTVRAITTTSSQAQAGAATIQTGIRNSTGFELTNGTGGQLLRARVAQGTSSVAFICGAWYYSYTNKTIQYTTSTTEITADATVATKTGWSSLLSGVSTATGTTSSATPTPTATASPAAAIFTVSGTSVTINFQVASTGDFPSTQVATSVTPRAEVRTGEPCFRN